MKKRIPIGDLGIGMFVEAEVRSVRSGGAIRHFLVAREAVYGVESGKKARLTHRKHEQVAHAGGLLMTSESHLAVLRATGLEVVTINTDKGKDLPDHLQPLEEYDYGEMDVSQGAMDAAEYEALLSGGAPLASGAPAPVEDCFLEVQEEAETLIPSHSSARPSAAPPPLAVGKRRNFGASQSGWMKVGTDSGGQQAVMQVLSYGGDASLGVADVLQALEELYGIREGLDRKLVEKLAAQAASWPQRVIRGRFPVAQAQRLRSGDQGRVDYTFLDGVDSGTVLPYGRLKTAFALETLPEVLAQQPLTRAVIPGEKLAVVSTGGGQTDLCNIFGASRTLNGPEALLKAGENVRVLGNNYVTEIYGYVCLLDDEISVVSPLWIAADRSEAHFVHFPQAGTRSTLVREWLEQLLKKERVTYGIRQQAFDELLAGVATGDAIPVLVALGKKAVPGEDARIEFTFDPEKWSCAELEDGSVDFHERNAFNGVEEGELLGELFLATRGKDGIDVRGEKIVVEDGRKRVFKAGDNVRVDSENGRPRFFYAEVNGNVKVKGDSVRVYEVVRIEGDVDYKLGHIEAGKDVYITGSVRSGFGVRAGGDIFIGGTVERGAAINAQGDVIVARGIVGADTRVVALGNVQTRFVHNSSVMARGDVLVGSYLLNARVQAGGQLVVRSGGDEGGGSIIGGRVFAAGGLRAVRVGSASTDCTVIGIEPPPNVAALLGKLDRGVAFCDRNIVRTFRTLGLKDIDVARFKKLIESTPREKREPMMRMLRQLKGLAQTRERAVRRRRKLERQSQAGIAQAQIKVFGKAFADVEIRMGRKRLVLSEELQAPTFSLDDDDISWSTIG